MDGLDQICKNAIELDKENPKVEIKAFRVFPDVDVYVMFEVYGYIFKRDKVFDYFHFNAYDLLNGVETGSTA